MPSIPWVNSAAPSFSSAPQAIYHRTGDADFAVAPYTTDGDLAVAPELLLDSPALAEAMARGGFKSEQPGIWKNADKVQIDLLVPETLGGDKGRRGAQLPPPHGRKVARKVRGLEAALVDKTPETISALDPTDSRRFEIAVAGPVALLVAKLHKIFERVKGGDNNRINDKDALDVLRLLRGTETASLATTLQALTMHEFAGTVAVESLDYLRSLFETNDSEGTRMAVRATSGLENPTTIAASCVVLASDLLSSAKI